MKKVISSVLVATLLLITVLSLASCGNTPKGTYASENGVVSVNFDGDKVAVTFKVVVSITLNGTFAMGENNEILITYEGEESSSSAPSGWTYDKDADAIKCDFLGAELVLNKVD